MSLHEGKIERFTRNLIAGYMPEIHSTANLFGLQDRCEKEGLVLDIRFRRTGMIAIDLKKNHTDEKPLEHFEVFPCDLPGAIQEVEPSEGTNWSYDTGSITGYVFLKLLAEQESESYSEEQNWISQLKKIASDYLAKQSTFDGYGDGKSLKQITLFLNDLFKKDGDVDFFDLVDKYLTDDLPLKGGHPLILIGRIAKLLIMFPIMESKELGEDLCPTQVEVSTDTLDGHNWLCLKIVESLVRRTLCVSKEHTLLFAKVMVPEDGARVNTFFPSKAGTLRLPNQQQRKILDAVAIDVSKDLKKFATKIDSLLTKLAKETKYQDTNVFPEKLPAKSPYR